MPLAGCVPVTPAIASARKQPTAPNQPSEKAKCVASASLRRNGDMADLR
jgi:hypothetical protein